VFNPPDNITPVQGNVIFGFVFSIWFLIVSFNIDNITGKIKINSRGLPVYRRQMTENRIQRFSILDLGPGIADFMRTLQSARG